MHPAIPLWLGIIALVYQAFGLRGAAYVAIALGVVGCTGQAITEVKKGRK